MHNQVNIGAQTAMQAVFLDKWVSMCLTYRISMAFHSILYAQLRTSWSLRQEELLHETRSYLTRVPAQG